MEKEANYFTVGIFVSLALLALVGFTIWLAGVHDFARYDRYTIYFTDPVSGLAEEATVKYKGVDVGKIESMRLAPDRNDLVKVDVKVKEETPVRASTVASIELQGITGQNFIDLSTAAADKNPPPQVAGEKYPVLKGTGSKFTKILDEVPQVTSQVRTTLSGIDDVSRGGAKMTESIRGLAEKLKENPSAILRSPTHRGVEIPK